MPLSDPSLYKAYKLFTVEITATARLLARKFLPSFPTLSTLEAQPVLSVPCLPCGTRQPRTALGGCRGSESRCSLEAARRSRTPRASPALAAGRPPPPTGATRPIPPGLPSIPRRGAAFVRRAGQGSRAGKGSFAAGLSSGWGPLLSPFPGAAAGAAAITPGRPGAALRPPLPGSRCSSFARTRRPGAEEPQRQLPGVSRWGSGRGENFAPPQQERQKGIAAGNRTRGQRRRLWWKQVVGISSWEEGAALISS